MSCMQVLFPESQSSSQHMGKTVPSSVRSDTHCQSLTSHDRDAQRVGQQAIIFELLDMQNSYHSYKL